MKNTKGFAVVEALLIFAIIGVLIGIGWYVYSQQNKNKNSDGEADSYSQQLLKSNREENTSNGYTHHTIEELSLTFEYPTNWGVVKKEELQDSIQEPSSKTMQYSFSSSDLVIAGHQNDFVAGQRGGSFFDYGGFESNGIDISLRKYDGRILEGTGSEYRLNTSENCAYINDQGNLVSGPTYHATCNLNKPNIYGINFIIDANNGQITFQQFLDLINSIKIE